MVACCCLDGPVRPADLTLDRLGLKRTRELFVLRLAAPYRGHGQHVLVALLLVVEHGAHHLPRLLAGLVRGVALLPQELPRAQKRGGVFELPPDDVGPLVDLQRQVTV